MDDRDELLDIKQAARFLRVSETSLRRWTASGRLPCLRVGGRRERRFRRSDLVAFLEEEPSAGGLPDSVAGGRDSYAVVQGLALMHGTHLFGVYGSDPGRATLAVSFVSDGLGEGSISYLVGGPEAWQETLLRLDRERGTVHADLAAGRILLVEYAASPEGQYAYFQRQFDRAMQAGVRSLRVVGDMWSMAERMGEDALVRYEAGFTEFVARRYPVVALCQYDARRFSGTGMLSALKTHPDAFRYPADRLLA